MTSISPGTSADGGAQDYDQKESRNPLSGFFKGLTSDKKTRDGQPAKRRGPKPDSKPALTRRQELNRQAQRTHRERKEMYIKALEQEVLRLKDHILNACKERDNAQEENRILKELLARHGIDFTGLISPGGTTGQSTFGDSSTGSVSGSYGGPRSNSTGFTSPPNVPGGGDFSSGQLPQFPAQGQANSGTNYDQVGIDFVLTLENPCMDHAGMLMGQAQRDERDFHGHAAMLTAPTESHLIARPDVPYHTVMPETGTLDLMKLLELSNRLPLDGEITPVMAWAMVLRHPRIAELNAADFDTLRSDLLAKVRCYGFGAVLEEFEVRDALSSVFATKIESYAIHQIHEDIRHYG